MKIKVFTVDASEPDCTRIDYCTMVDGEEICLAASCLPGSPYAFQEMIEKARKIFGADVTVEVSR
jgi:hypothetical protein